MSFSIRTSLLSAAMLCAIAPVFALGHSIRPVSLPNGRLFLSVKKWDAAFRLPENSNKPSTKICSCQILNMQSTNYHLQNMVVLAEKTRQGKVSGDLSINRQAIEKEKKHIRLMFFDKLKVTGHISAASDCQSLFDKLKSADSSLALYGILNADVKR